MTLYAHVMPTTVSCGSATTHQASSPPPLLKLEHSRSDVPTSIWPTTSSESAPTSHARDTVFAPDEAPLLSNVMVYWPLSLRRTKGDASQ